MNILLHDDWEIYGDGSGNPEQLMFEPARRILDICDIYGAKYTFFAEIGQQLHMLNASEPSWRKCAAHWETTLKDAVSRGHDVQLHFHPQWIGANLKNGSWQLNHTYWNTGHIEPAVLTEWIGKGKKYLEDLLQPVNNNFTICSYRAGGWMCQPSSGIYTALRDNGIVSDVSIMPGRHCKYADGGQVDFRDAHSRFMPWEVDPDDFSQYKQGSGIWEFPVYTETSSLPHMIYLLKKAFYPRHYYKIYNARKLHKGKGAYSPSIVERGKAKEYYGSFGYMHYKHLLTYVNDIRQNKDTSGNPKYLILLTHSKSFLDYTNFENFLKSLSRYEDVVFSTTRSFVKNFISNNHSTSTQSTNENGQTS